MFAKYVAFINQMNYSAIVGILLYVKIVIEIIIKNNVCLVEC